jgi:hypothetical protein
MFRGLSSCLQTFGQQTFYLHSFRLLTKFTINKMAAGVMSCSHIDLDGEQYTYLRIYTVRQNDGRRNVILPNVLVKNVDKHSMLVQEQIL